MKPEDLSRHQQVHVTLSGTWVWAQFSKDTRTGTSLTCCEQPSSPSCGREEELDARRGFFFM